MPAQAELAAARYAARRSFAPWSATLPFDRYRIIVKAAALLRERAPAISRVLTLEQGKPLAESSREVMLSADIIDFLAEEARRLASRGVPPRTPNVSSQTVTRVPVGPVAAFTPWNFPMNLPARKLGGALAAGCSVIIKPDEETPASCMELVRCFVDAGLPPGVLNMVLGRPADIADALIASPEIAKVSFTGSTPVGRMLAEKAARHLKRFTAELGGHAPVIVCGDADPVETAKLAVAAKYRGAGQVCASPVRFLVHRSIYAAFRDAFVAGARALKIGSGMDDGVQMGPLVAKRRVDEMSRLVDDAVAHGAALLCGGKPVARPGFFFEATVLEARTAGCRVQLRRALRADRAARRLRRTRRRDQPGQRAALRPGGLRVHQGPGNGHSPEQVIGRRNGRHQPLRHLAAGNTVRRNQGQRHGIGKRPGGVA